MSFQVARTVFIHMTETCLCKFDRSLSGLAQLATLYVNFFAYYQLNIQQF